jgi:predicted NBD/HSP70 family sugar kinase
MPATGSPQARHWRSAAAALDLVRRRHEPTRHELALELGLASGAASDLVGRLRAARLIAERPAAAQRPGRPTTRLHAHPDGPVVLAVDLRHGDWRLAACGVDGEVELLASELHRERDADAVLARLRRVINRAADWLDGRALAVGVAVPGLTAGTRVLDASMLGWREVELDLIAAGLPLIAGNDATMAAIAEARARPAARVLLHLVLEVGIGGALVLGGRPVQGARGLGGEFGHLPFGDSDQACACGARGCWGVAFDPRRLAARLGEPEPRDPRGWLRRIIESSEPTAGERRLREELAGDLGRGAAGLVNALDPDTVTWGGLAGPLWAAAPDAFHGEFEAGLMGVHRRPAPDVAAGRGGEDAVLVGLGLVTFDHILNAQQLARWASRAA